VYHAGEVRQNDLLRRFSPLRRLGGPQTLEKFWLFEEILAQKRFSLFEKVLPLLGDLPL
jgi:hypothetical protein